MGLIVYLLRHMHDFNNQISFATISGIKLTFAKNFGFLNILQKLQFVFILLIRKP